MIKKLLRPYEQKAVLLGTKAVYLCHIANGHRKPSIRLAKLMLSVLGIPLYVSRPDVYDKPSNAHHQGN